MNQESHTSPLPAGCRTEWNAYTFFWIFFFGSLAGFISETLWGIFTAGELASRSSFVFGPFTVVYGVGAVALYLLLRKVNRNQTAKIFVIGVLSGTAVEFFCSWFQEAMFGTVSWDYSDKLLNVGGRVCFMFSFFWGLLALLWVRHLQPALLRLIARLPRRQGDRLAGVLAGTLLFLTLVSAAAVWRWMLRLDGVPPDGALELVLDRYFTDDIMTGLYSGMKIRG